MPLMKAVVILGAGASAGFGVPTLRYIFQDRHARAHLAADQFLRRKLVNSIWAPRGVDLDTSHLSLTVEEILTMLRDAENQEYGRPPLIPRNQAERFRRSLYVLIKRAVYEDKNLCGPRPCSRPKDHPPAASKFLCWSELYGAQGRN